MGLSVANLEPINKMQQVSTRPEAYAVSNEAPVSDAFSESLSVASANRVSGAAPVVYPNAQVQVDEVGKVKRSQDVNRVYNKIASAYNGAATSYNAAREATGYDVVGSRIDAYA